MRSIKSSKSNSRNHQPSSSAPIKKKSPKAGSNNPKFTHFFFVLRNAKQFHHFTSHFISATVNIHPDLAAISSTPVLCHHSQADFQFGLCIDLANSNVSDSPELFSPKITISVNDSDYKESVGTVNIQPNKPKTVISNGHPIIYLVNHQDLPLKLLSSPKIGGFINVTCAFGYLDQKQIIDPSLEFIEVSMQQLQKTSQEPEIDAWEADAIENGWVPPEKAAEIWQKIAREHGWKSPEDRNMIIQFNTIEDKKPAEHDNTDLISFSSDDENLTNNHQDTSFDQKDDQTSSNTNDNKYEDNVEAFVNFALASKYTIQTNDVFDQNPKRHQLSHQFTIFEMQPEWQPTDSDTDLNQDLTNLLTSSPNNDLYDLQKPNLNSPKNEKKK